MQNDGIVNRYGSIDDHFNSILVISEGLGE